MTISSNLLYYLFSKRRRVVEKNVKLAFEESKDVDKNVLINQFYLHMSAFLKEFFFYNYYSKRLTLTIMGLSSLDDALKKNRGVLLMCPHLGNWELVLPALPKRLGMSNTMFHCVRKTFKNKWLYSRCVSNHKQNNFNIIPSKGGSKKIIKALKNNEVVFFAYDQRANKKNAVLVNLFGHKTWTYTSLNRFAEINNTPILIFYTYRVSKYKHAVRFLPEIRTDNKTSVQAKAELNNMLLEEVIKKHPEQWYCWLHDLWKINKMD